MTIIHGFLHLIGVRDAGSYWNNFWSGFGSDIGEFGILVVLWRKLQCHGKGCRRMGLHHVPGTPYVTCKKHHPTHGVSVEDIHRAHAKANADHETVAVTTPTPRKRAATPKS